MRAHTLTYSVLLQHKVFFKVVMVPTLFEGYKGTTQVSEVDADGSALFGSDVRMLNSGVGSIDLLKEGNIVS